MYIAPSCCYKACVHRPRLRTVQAADGNMQDNRGIGIDSTCTSHLVCSTRSGQQGSKEATKTLTGAFRNIQNRDATWHREGAGQPEPAAAPLLGRVPTLNRPLCRPRLELRVVSLVRPGAQGVASNFKLPSLHVHSSTALYRMSTASRNVPRASARLKSESRAVPENPEALA